MVLTEVNTKKCFLSKEKLISALSTTQLRDMYYVPTWCPLEPFLLFLKKFPQLTLGVQIKVVASVGCHQDTRPGQRVTDENLDMTGGIQG